MPSASARQLHSCPRVEPATRTCQAGASSPEVATRLTVHAPATTSLSIGISLLRAASASEPSPAASRSAVQPRPPSASSAKSVTVSCTSISASCSRRRRVAVTASDALGADTRCADTPIARATLASNCACVPPPPSIDSGSIE